MYSIMQFKVIIAGGRDFKDYSKLSLMCSQILSKKGECEIVSGGAKGADKLGEKFALDNNIPLKKFPANWSKHGISAGPRRNKEMGEYADALIAFWDGKSKGTENMIKEAKKLELKIRIIYY